MPDSNVCDRTLGSEQDFESLKEGWHGAIVADKHTDTLKPQKSSHHDTFKRTDLTELVSTISFQAQTLGASILVTTAPKDHPKH